jgi:hypothetical protein
MMDYNGFDWWFWIHHAVADKICLIMSRWTMSQWNICFLTQTWLFETSNIIALRYSIHANRPTQSWLIKRFWCFIMRRTGSTLRSSVRKCVGFSHHLHEKFDWVVLTLTTCESWALRQASLFGVDFKDWISFFMNPMFLSFVFNSSS